MKALALQILWKLLQNFVVRCMLAVCLQHCSRGRAGGAIWCGNCSSVSGQSPAPSAPFIPTWRHRDTQPWATLCRVLWGILSVLLARGWVTRHLNPSHAATEIPSKCIPTEQTCITHYTIHMTQLTALWPWTCTGSVAALHRHTPAGHSNTMEYPLPARN